MTKAYKETKTINNRENSSKSLDYEGKLIYLIDEIRINGDGLKDLNYNVVVRAAKLKRIVEIYQWHEKYTDKIDSDGSTYKNYFYFKDWSESIIDSRDFHSLIYRNTLTRKPLESKIYQDERVFLGDFEMCDEAKDMIDGWIDVVSNSRPNDPYVKVYKNAFYHADNLLNFQIGDMRVRYQYAGLEGDVYTIVGKFEKGKIVPFDHENKEMNILLSKGNLNKEEIFQQAANKISIGLWFARFYAFILIMFFVSSTEDFTRIILCNSILSFLTIDQDGSLKDYLRVSLLYSIIICSFVKLLLYIGIL